jgi:hypothetical protein
MNWIKKSLHSSLHEALLLSKSLDSKGCYWWYTCTYIKYIAQEAGLEIKDLEFSGDYNRKKESIKKHFKTCMTNFYQNIFLNKFSTIDNSSKLILFKDLKRDLNMENYLLHENFEKRRLIT